MLQRYGSNVFLTTRAVDSLQLVLLLFNTGGGKEHPGGCGCAEIKSEGSVGTDGDTGGNGGSLIIDIRVSVGFMGSCLWPRKSWVGILRNKRCWFKAQRCPAAPAFPTLSAFQIASAFRVDTAFRVIRSFPNVTQHSKQSQHSFNGTEHSEHISTLPLRFFLFRTAHWSYSLRLKGMLIRSRWRGALPGLRWDFAWTSGV
jgi:hypothetical protein